MKRLLVLAVAAALAISALAATASAGSEKTYKVTVTNLTTGGGQVMTPYVVATHQGSFNLFQKNGPASNGVQQVAENGAVPVLVAELQANSRVGDVSVAAPAAGPPVFAGQSVSTTVVSTPGDRKLSVLGMLICTNDGFGGVNGVNLPGNGSATYYGQAYDAGTEITTEAYEDLVPPCDGSGGTGMSNPALAQNGTIQLHAGIQGIADLSPTTHGWTGSVIKIEVELISR
jgi:opacity protein-like surface antigen